MIPMIHPPAGRLSRRSDAATIGRIARYSASKAFFAVLSFTPLMAFVAFL